MADDVIFVPPGDEGTPGEFRMVEGEKFVIMSFIEPGTSITLKNGQVVRPMRVFVDECLTKLYIRARARDN